MPPALHNLFNAQAPSVPTCPFQIPAYLKRNAAAIQDEQQQIETFMRMHTLQVGGCAERLSFSALWQRSP